MESRFRSFSGGCSVAVLYFFLGEDMPVTYEKCGDNVVAVMRRMIKEHHPDLIEAKATIQCLFANAGEDKKGNAKPAVKRQGVACAAKVKIVSLKDRAAGNADAEIILDEHVWNRLTKEERDALFDHELEHLTPKREGGHDGAPIETDDLGRPKFKMKQHDWEVWGFASIVERHGNAALDFQAAQQFKDKFGQLLMWAENKELVG
jgi:hypothetical protein